MKKSDQGDRRDKDDKHKNIFHEGILHCATGSTEEGSDASTATNSVSPLNADGFGLGISPVNFDSSLSRGDGCIINTHRFLRSNSTAITKDQDDYMIAPSTREEKENERYARKVGICFSITRGDYLTLFSGLGDDESMTDISATLSASPQYGKKDDCFTFREMYGDVNQILETSSSAEEDMAVIHQVVDPAKSDESFTVQPHHELITPRTRTAMIIHNDVLETIRERAAILSKDWADKDNLAPSLARRLRDFEFAQKKRRKTLGRSRKWGILGLYDFLSAVRQDVEWAEEAAFRRSNCLPYLRWCDYVDSKRVGSNRPFFAYGILLICSITLITSIGLNGWSFESMTRNPSLGPSAEVLLQMGAKESNLIVNSYQVWRLITPMILHGGIVHFLLNCFAMFYIGRAVEQNHGFMSAVILFVVSAIGSTIVSAIFLPQFISVGSSGGIFGLIGACVADIIKNRKLLFSDFINKGRSRRHHAFVVLVLVIDVFLNLLMGLTPYTDNFMHIGGFVLGFACATTMLTQVDIVGEKHPRVKSRTYLLFSRYFGLVISCVCILAALVILFTGDGTTSPCESCGVLSCVSLPPWADHDKKWWYCDSCGSVKAFGQKDPITDEYVAIEMECPQGNSVLFSLDGIANDKESLQKNLPNFCRERCFN